MKSVAQPLEVVIKAIAQVIGYPLGKELGQVTLSVAEYATHDAGYSDGQR
jgi:hypothetical protein